MCVLLIGSTVASIPKKQTQNIPVMRERHCLESETKDLKISKCTVSLEIGAPMAWETQKSDSFRKRALLKTTEAPHPSVLKQSNMLKCPKQGLLLFSNIRNITPTSTSTQTHEFSRNAYLVYKQSLYVSKNKVVLLNSLFVTGIVLERNQEKGYSQTNHYFSPSSPF